MPQRLRKPKVSKPKQKPNQANQIEPPGLSYFCELSLYAKFQSSLVVFKLYFYGGRGRRKEEELAVLEAA